MAAPPAVAQARPLAEASPTDNSHDAIVFATNILAGHAALGARTKRDKAVARNLAIVAASARSAAPGRLGTVPEFEAWVRRTTTVQNTAAVTDEVRALLENRPTRRMRAAIEARSTIPLVDGLSRVLSCEPERARQLLSASKELGIGLENLAKLPKVAKRLRIRGTLCERLARLPDLSRPVPCDAALEWWARHATQLLAPVSISGEGEGQIRTRALVAQAAGDARRGAPRATELPMLVVAPPGLSPERAAAIVAERLAATLPKDDYVFLRRFVPGEGVARVEALARVEFAESEKEEGGDEAGADSGAVDATPPPPPPQPSPPSLARRWMRVSVDFATLETAPPRMLFLTGPEAHFEQMRAEAQAKGFRLDPTSFVLKKGRSVGAVGTDDDGVYAALGVGTVAPGGRHELPTLAPRLVARRRRRRRRRRASRKRRLRSRRAASVVADTQPGPPASADDDDATTPPTTPELLAAAAVAEGAGLVANVADVAAMVEAAEAADRVVV